MDSKHHLVREKMSPDYIPDLMGQVRARSMR